MPEPPDGAETPRARLYSEDARELLRTETLDDPYPLFARLRRDAPIARIADTGVHLVASWDLVEEALGREDDFSANLTGVLVADANGAPSTFPLPDSGASHVIATADEPEHALHRRIAQPRLTPARVARLEADLRRWASESLGPFVTAGGGEFVPIAERIPARAVARILGLPDGDVERHRRWAMMGGEMLAGRLEPERLGLLARESAAMADYLGAALDAPAPAGDDDEPMRVALARAAAAGDLPREAAVGIAIVMFGAGGESTAALLASAVWVLARGPELVERLRRDPGGIPRFVEEVARLESPFRFHYRVVRRRCVLGGARLEPGDRLMLLWASANRDEQHFEAADQLRLDRRHPKRHLGFGRGGHFCIGAPLARLEARVLLEELLGRTSSIALAGAPVFAPSVFVRRLESLPLRVVATRPD
ncbi:MAG: cytochrome P450 [Myxococcota bacterium]